MHCQIGMTVPTLSASEALIGLQACENLNCPPHF